MSKFIPGNLVPGNSIRRAFHPRGLLIKGYIQVLYYS